MEVKRGFIFDPSLVLYLPLYELDGTSFMSKDKHGHLGTVTGALWRPQGRYFDGIDDQIDLGSPSPFNITQAITFDYWWYNQTEGIVVFLSKGARDESWTGSFSIRMTGESLVKLMLNGTAGVSPGVIIPQNTWSHIVHTYDRTNIIDYLNGQKETSGAYTGAISTNAYSLIIGTGFGTATNRHVRGICGEIRIYNRALTAVEIQNIYLATKWRYR